MIPPKMTQHIALRVVLLVVMLLAGAAWLETSLGARGVVVAGGVINVDTTWSAADSPIDVTGVVTVAANARLTIEPGVVARFASGTALQIDGELIARGTAAAPIRFTSAQPTVAPGQWGFVLINDGASDVVFDATGAYAAGTILEHVVIEGAGGTVPGISSPLVALRLLNAAPLVSHARIENNRGAGVNVVLTSVGREPLILDSTIAANDEGITASSGVIAGMAVHVERTRVTQNRGRGITLISTPGAKLSANTIEDNSLEGILASGNNGPLRIEGNTIRRNQRAGIFVTNAVAQASARVLDNVVQANISGGISIDASFVQSNVTEVRRNRILGNTGANAIAAALHVRAAGPTSITHNVIAGNTSTTRTIVSVANIVNTATVAHNVITRNQALRIIEGSLAPSSTQFPALSLAENTVVDNRPVGTSRSAIEFTFTSGRPWTVTSNNIDNPEFGFELRHALPSNVPAMNATNNWWGSANLALVRTRIFDQFYSSVLGVITFDPALTSPSITAPVSPPRSVTALTSPDGVRINWQPNPESDVLGYRVFYGSQAGPDYAHSADAGTATTYTLTGLPPGTTYVAVAAYDNDSNGVDDLFEGHQSWFSAEVAAVTTPTQPPVANPGGPYLVASGETVTLDGSASHDPDAGDAITSYEWDLDNDGVYDATGATVNVTPPAFNLVVGAHTIRLRVTDAFGFTGTATTTLTVVDGRPTAQFTATPNPAACAQPIQFDAGASSHSGVGRQIVTYQWNFGDGTTATGPAPTKTYARFGTYTASLTVVDDNVPPQSASVSLPIQVSLGNHPPAAVHTGPYSVILGAAVFLDARGSVDPDAACGDSIVSYEWTVGSLVLQGDRVLLSAQQIIALGPEGVYPVTLRLTDEHGAVTVAPTTLTTVNGTMTIASDTTWRASDSPIDVTKNVVVASGVTLTIEAGVTARFTSGAALQIDGTLIARGTEASPIRLTSAQTPVAPARWGYVLLTDTAVDATYDAGGAYAGGSILEHVIIEGAGGSVVGQQAAPTALRLFNAAPLIRHARIVNNRGPGISIVATTLPAPSARILDSTVEDNDQGLNVSAVAPDATVHIEGTRIAGNRGPGVSLVDSTAATLLHNEIADNDGNGIGVHGSRGALRIENNTITGNHRGLHVVVFCCSVTTQIVNNVIEQNAPLGAILLDDSVYQFNTSEVRGNQILRNSTTTSLGAGLYLQTAGTATIAENTIRENTSTARAIVSVEVRQNRPVTFSHNLVAENTAPRIFESPFVSLSTLSLPELTDNVIAANHSTGAGQSALHFTYGNGRHWAASGNNIDNPSFSFELRHALHPALPTMDARNNWWGSADVALVRSRIYDQQHDPAIGIVNIEPILAAPSPTAGITAPDLRVHPVISWSPASIIYGTPLGAAQFNATADAPGTFSYSLPEGTILDAGNGQTIQATFTPADPAAYHAATATATIDVHRAPLLLTLADGYVARSYYDAPSVRAFDSVIGFKGSDAFGVAIADLPAGTPPGEHRPLQFGVISDPAQRAANYDLVLADPQYHYRIDYPAIGAAAVAPQSAVKGAEPVVLTIRGHDFVPASATAVGTIVAWDGTPLSVTFVSRTELQAAVPAALLSAIGSAQITVKNPGAAGEATTPFFITDAETTVIDAATGTGTGVTIATPPSGGNPPLLEVSAAGEGIVSIASYGGNPSGVFVAANAFFDVFVTPSSAFTGLTMTVCPPEADSQVLWFDGEAWSPVSHQVQVGACVVVTITATTSPSLAQLTGTYFAAVVNDRDTTAPVVSAAADRDVLWPPNGKLVPVVISGRAADAASPIASLRYRTIDSYHQVQPGGAAQADASGRYSFVVMLPAERRGNDKAGRTFTIEVTAIDAAGNAATATVTIAVPHDRRK